MTTQNEVISGITRDGIILIGDLFHKMPTHLSNLTMLSGIEGRTLFHNLDEDQITLTNGLIAYNINKYCTPLDTGLSVFNFVSDELYEYFKRTSFVEDLKLKPLNTVTRINSIINVVTCKTEPYSLTSGELNAAISLADVYKALDTKSKSITVLATEETYTKYTEHLNTLALYTEGYNVIVFNKNGVLTMMKLVHRLGLTGIAAHKTLTL